MRKLTGRKKAEMAAHVEALTKPVIKRIDAVLRKHNRAVLEAVQELHDRTTKAERERDEASIERGQFKLVVEAKTASLMQAEESLAARDVELMKARLDANLLRSALRLARTSLDQGQTLKGQIAANGPTIGEVIDAALAAKEPT